MFKREYVSGADLKNGQIQILLVSIHLKILMAFSSVFLKEKHRSICIYVRPDRYKR